MSEKRDVTQRTSFEKTLSKETEDNALFFGDVSLTILSQKRVGFLFDSTLTAFLMMGNLSPGLKNHAVTMFEVGKLTDESLDSFLNELSGVCFLCCLAFWETDWETATNVNNCPQIREESEGDAQRYFEHAITLYKTLCFLRKNDKLILNDKKGLALGLLLSLFSFFSLFHCCHHVISRLTPDMLRYESLYSLDSATCQRVLSKNYELLVSMTPVSVECKTLRTCLPIHIGPAIPEALHSSPPLFFVLVLFHFMSE